MCHLIAMHLAASPVRSISVMRFCSGELQPVKPQEEDSQVLMPTHTGCCRKWFDKVVLGEECAHPKPYPDPYLEGLKFCGAKPEETIVCEDSPSGGDSAPHTAKHGGVDCIF